MLKRFEEIVKRCIYAAGFELRRLNVTNSEIGLTLGLLRHANCDIVLDVGANVGQFGRDLCQLRPDLPIVSFEPQSTAHAKLCAMARRFPQWAVAEQVAIGAEEGEALINLSRNSYSSSLLPINRTHVDSAPESVYVGQERVRVARLDDVALPYLHGRQRAFLKIDTQGFEEPVLTGAVGLLDRCVALKIELSFSELYVGQVLGFEMLERVKAMNYKLFGICSGIRNPDSGELLQADAYFIRG